MRVVGLPPKCARPGCDNRVETNKNGYNLQCDECLGIVRHRTNGPWGIENSREFRLIDRSVPCGLCGARIGEDCTSVRGAGPMNGVHKERKLDARA